MKLLMMSAAVAVAMIAVPATAQVMVPAEYVMTAGASDLYEITSSQVLLETTQDPKLRTFAQMMIADARGRAAATAIDLRARREGVLARSGPRS